MSVNNQLIIYKTKEGRWTCKHMDLDCGPLSDKFSEHDNLEDAVNEANKFIQESEFGIEYGLKIKI